MNLGLVYHRYGHSFMQVTNKGGALAREPNGCTFEVRYAWQGFAGRELEKTGPLDVVQG